MHAHVCMGVLEQTQTCGSRWDIRKLWGVCTGLLPCFGIFRMPSLPHPHELKMPGTASKVAACVLGSFIFPHGMSQKITLRLATGHCVWFTLSKIQAHVRKLHFSQMRLPSTWCRAQVFQLSTLGAIPEILSCQQGSPVVWIVSKHPGDSDCGGCLATLGEILI